MVEIKAKLQLWKQNTQNVLRGRMGSTRSRSSSNTTQESRTSADTQSSDSFTGQQNRERSSSHETLKQPAQSGLSNELERVAALQNKVPSRMRAMIADHDGRAHRLMPAYVRSDALHTLGYAKSAKRSKQILQLLEHTGVMSSDKLITRGSFNMDTLISVSAAWPGIKPLSAKEQQGLRVYVEGMQNNLDELGKKFLDVDASQRPYALYYARLTATPEDSRTTLINLQGFKVIDESYNPVDGGRQFEIYKHAFNRSLAERYSHDSNFDQIFALSLDHTEALRDALFPLPLYTGPKTSR